MSPQGLISRFTPAWTAVLVSFSVSAEDLRFSDPALQSSAPAHAVGYPSHAADLDVLAGFRMPPPGYGEVAFYWWLGDPLTRERLKWHLDLLADKGISGLQVNYAHSDKGGRSWGLTFPSEPALFSKPWWDLFGWFLSQARQRGMAASLSDYTLGWAGNGWYFDEILRDHPDMHGRVLESRGRECSGPGRCAWPLGVQPLTINAYRHVDGKNSAEPAVDLSKYVADGALQWDAPPGTWRLIEVHVKEEPVSIDPMHPLSGKQMIAKFFQRFEDRNPGQSGRGLNFFFSDELSFGVRGWLWSKEFAREFQKRKGYDIVPELAALFEDVGPRTPKIRLDYSDVMVTLEEENYFRPLYEWHRSRGMLYGCDHGGRGRDVTEFGDYFRTQRWMTGPGNDQPGLQSDVIKNKVSSSISHLYQRPRTWLEGYYGSGWGTTTAQIVDATWRNFVQGQNLLTLHGLYYSTHGGWWEWAPPCNHFHMPYWNHMGEFLHAVERMSYALSQGFHRADVAVVYPVAAMEAGPGGKESVNTAFDIGQHLYGKGIDFDFIDFESLARSKVEGPELNVSGEAYRALVIPAMQTVRYSTIEKALEFQRRGGVVILAGALPQASDRAGRDDRALDDIVRELAAAPGARATLPVDVERRVNTAFPRDFVCRTGGAPSPNVLHRKPGQRDIYMVYGAARGTECEFRSTGRVELWNPWDGTTSPLQVIDQSAEVTRVRMPLESTEAQLIVFNPGQPLRGPSNPEPKPVIVPVSGPWEFELKPTLDNRYGDYRLPVETRMIGPEARRFRYSDEAPGSASWSDPKFDDSAWRRTTVSYGPRFWKLGPLPAEMDRELERGLATGDSIDPSQTVTSAGRSYQWTPYEFSMRWGLENDPGHQGYHGLKEEVPGEMIALGKIILKSTTTEYTAEDGGTRYYLATTVLADHNMVARVDVQGNPPSGAWVNGKSIIPTTSSVGLKGGQNVLLLRYDGPGKGSFFLFDPMSPSTWTQTFPLASRWYNRPGLLTYDVRPQTAQPAGWYRFTAPPGFRGMRVIARGGVEAWASGVPMQVSAAKKRTDGSREYTATTTPSSDPAVVAIRIEQERGFYGGAAIPEAVALDCAPGRIPAGDWSEIDGLSSYSGGAWYRKTVSLTDTSRPVWLNLGSVAGSVEVRVNGQRAGTKLAPPWTVDISQHVKQGSNRIELLIYNTLANHYQTIPTRYRGSPASGLIGPVSVELR